MMSVILWILVATMIATTWLFVGFITALLLENAIEKEGKSISDQMLCFIILVGPVVFPLMVFCLVLYLIACTIFGRMKVDKFIS